MASSKPSLPRGVAGAVAAALLVARAKDARHLPRLLVGQDGSPLETLHIVASALTIYGYEKVVARVLKAAGMSRIPSTLAAMLSLFAILRTTEKAAGKQTSDRIAALLRPGVDFLGKWMGAFLAPPLVGLDASIRALPLYSGRVWVNAVSLLSAGWAATHSTAGIIASLLAPKRAALINGNGHGTPQVSATKSAANSNVGQNGTEGVSLDEAIRRSYVLLGAASFLGVACFSSLPAEFHRPIGMLAEFTTTVGSLALAKLLPDKAQRVLHPLVICAVSSNLATKFVGPVAPYMASGVGVGDRLFQWLPAAVTGLGVRMYSTTHLWLNDADDFKCVLLTCGSSGVASLAITSALAVAPSSPLSLPAPLSLPMLHRSVMSALGIEGSLAIGPECDPKLAVASILITGCIGASLGTTLLDSLPAVFNASSPLVRGVAMGCSAHSIGTAGLISNGDTEAAAISGASMCLAGTAHTIALQLPGLVPAIRSLAQLPP